MEDFTEEQEDRQELVSRMALATQDGEHDIAENLLSRIADYDEKNGVPG